MRDKKQRRKILTGRSDSDFWLFFLSFYENVGSALLSFSLMPAFELFFFFVLSLELAAFSSCGGFPHESVGWRQLRAGWDGEERETEGERGCFSRHACVGSSQSPPVPWDANTQPSQARHRASRLYPGRLRPGTSWCVIEIAHRLFGLLIPQQDSVCCSYSITTRLCWLARFAYLMWG